MLPPHDDVATGNFAASEFAADLYKVAFGGEQDSGYADAVEFFRRTYLTEGLSDLVGRAVRRLSGDDNAPPVINLQTNFGGGKTHSMLALWQVAAGLPVGEFPQETQDLLTANGYAGDKINRVAIVGNHFSPSGETKDDGTHVNTIWGELAWQLGGAEAFALVAKADSDRTTPGEALHEVLAKYSPAVILIDEWVAYARSLVGRDDLAGGTFDDQFTFAQSLTEAAKGTSGVLLVISIPASESGDDADQVVAGNAEEVGGAHGLEALKRLQNVVRRVADQWRPASSAEAYQIVRQRLFKQADAAALASIGATARAYVDMYRKYTDDFPRESRDSAYEDRIKRTYPIHPELFDRLYEEWSSLERFQRTRGVLRLMSTVIHALWTGEDASPLIMPGSIPLATANVNAELTQYLQDSWKAIIDADVDGPNSEPARIDKEKPLFGTTLPHETSRAHPVRGGVGFLGHDLGDQLAELGDAGAIGGAAEHLPAVHVVSGQIGERAAALVGVVDPHPAGLARGQGGVAAAAGLDRGLLVGGDHVIIGPQRFPAPNPGVEVEHTVRLALEVGVADEDPRLVVPRFERILGQPPAHRCRRDRRADPVGDSVFGQVRARPPRQWQAPLRRWRAGHRLNPGDLHRGELGWAAGSFRITQ